MEKRSRALELARKPLVLEQRMIEEHERRRQISLGRRDQALAAGVQRACPRTLQGSCAGAEQALTTAGAVVVSHLEGSFDEIRVEAQGGRLSEACGARLIEEPSQCFVRVARLPERELEKSLRGEELEPAGHDLES